MTDDRFRAALRAAGWYEGKTYHDSWQHAEFGVVYEGTDKFRALRALCEHYAGNAVQAERDRCARIVDDTVRAVDAADALEAIRGEHYAGGWVSVDERLPEPCEAVQVFCQYRACEEQDVAYLADDGSWCSESDERRLPVTHWRPLPPPPEGE